MMNKAQAIRDKLNGYSKECPQDFTCAPGFMGMLNGKLTYALKSDAYDWKRAAAYRRMVLAWLFTMPASGQSYPDHTAISSKELSAAQVYALSRWIDPWYNEIEGCWETATDFSVEAATVLVQALADLAERDTALSVE